MKRELDAHTIRSVVRGQRARMRRNGQHWPHDEWVFMQDFLDRLTAKAVRIEKRAKGAKR